jgi:O-6-methylguanine DNA methyltransferase
MMENADVLRRLRAPEDFLDGVLRKVGLVDRYAQVESPIGTVRVAVGKHGISAVMRAKSDAEFERRYREQTGRRAERHDDMAEELGHAIAGSGGIGVDLRGCNGFQRAVLDATRTIPSGSVRPYAWIAREIGKPKAVRAVGTALAQNPVPLVVPCHRVVRSDGDPGEYGLGAGTRDKVALLQHEGIDIGEMRKRVSARAFWAIEGEDTYCYPYCFEQQLEHDRVVRFDSAHDAHRQGLTPCATCRPPLPG